MLLAPLPVQLPLPLPALIWYTMLAALGYGLPMETAALPRHTPQSTAL